ncbi:MAG: hypothetical protein N2745_09760 [Syntrophorhabdaceae bacterium]|nr:hypothetical protein [Syntrophorhabdaceae bacterium]
MMDDRDHKETQIETPKNLTTFDPDKPPYQRLHLCIYLRELLEEAEKESESKKG